jgi:hypothetical protein
MRRESSSLISARLSAPTGVRRSACLVVGGIFYLEPPRGGLQNDMLVSLHTVQCTTPKTKRADTVTRRDWWGSARL